MRMRNPSELVLVVLCFLVYPGYGRYSGSRIGGGGGGGSDPAGSGSGSGDICLPGAATTTLTLALAVFRYCRYRD
ncbi:hypothetical protein F4678DRAFT_453095 [Xylaria arbuscula]|nr:hypothetical protein F4678DRAFT_453095 [Xylaria arbuscula]